MNTRTSSRNYKGTLDLFASADATLSHPARRSNGRVRSRLPCYRVELVRERDYDGPPCRTPSDIARLLGDFLARADREHFCTVLLANNLRPIGISVVSVGTLTAALVSPREVFKAAILANAAQVVVSHNHPSGSLEPSREDIAITKKLVEAGKLLDIPVVDHIIVGHGGAYTSLAERGLM